MAAVVIMGNAPADRLHSVLAALDGQILPVRQIIVHVAEGAPAQAALTAILTRRADVTAARPGYGKISDEIEAVMLLSNTVTLRPEATAAMAAEMRVRDADLVYADEVFVDEDGVLAEPFFKPSYSPRLSAATNYIGNCALIRAKLFQSLLIDHFIDDAALEIDVASFITAISANLDRGHIANVPMPLVEDNDWRRATLPGPSRHPVIQRRGTATIIIPTRDRLHLLAPCIESILAKTKFARESYEIIVVDNGSTDTATLSYLKEGNELGKFRIIHDGGDFNYARLNNGAARVALSDVLVFLNNDTVVIQDDWLERLVDAALDPCVGIVGAKLLYEDDSVQHGGVVLGIQGVAGHADVHLGPSDSGYHGLALHDREVSAVTGACMAVTRQHFWQAGGFDEALAVAFNDTVLCINMLKMGLFNLQLNSVLVRHLESKSRGFDDTPDRKAKFLEECLYARGIGQKYFLNDIYYSPNLSLHETNKRAVVARRRKPWRAPRLQAKPRILILSSTHQRGHGVPVVIERHANYFCSAGFNVHIGGPQTADDLHYEGCVRAVVNNEFEAAFYAFAHDIDIVMPHTPPFFSVARWSGPYPFVAPYDHGEPPSAFFVDAIDRNAVLTEKAFSLSLAHRRYCNSPSVRDDSGFDDMIVVPLGNSHMAQWDRQLETVRQAVRARRGWTDKIVVLNVCRFHEAERRYKGVEAFIEIAKATRRARTDGTSEIVFVQCGKGNPEDVTAILKCGIDCYANVTDREMVELYCAADVYANFSQWEGWNLGIAQALAYGLPIIASDIPAHRQNFDIFTTSDVLIAAREIIRLAENIAAAGYSPERIPLINTWEEQLSPFTDDLLNSWREWG